MVTTGTKAEVLLKHYKEYLAETEKIMKDFQDPTALAYGEGTVSAMRLVISSMESMFRAELY